MLHRLACASFIALSAPALAMAADSSAAKSTTAPAADSQTAATASKPAAASKPVHIDTVLATVGDTKITVGNLIEAKASLPQQYQKMPMSMLFKPLLDQLVNQEVLKQSYNGDVPAEVKLSLENTRRSMLASVALADYLKTAVTDDMIQKKYNDEYGAGYKPKEEYHASHILLKTKAEAEDVIKKYKAGTPFAKLAKESSTGPSGPNGGDLGWFTADQMIPEFSKAVEALKPGEISEPVKTQFGWHVILLQDTRKKAPELKDVKAKLTSEIQQDLTKKYIDGLVSKADVDKSGSDGIDPKALDSINLE